MNSTGDSLSKIGHALKTMLEKLKFSKVFFTKLCSTKLLFLLKQKNQKVLDDSCNGKLNQILALFDNLSPVEFTKYSGFLKLSWFLAKDLTF